MTSQNSLKEAALHYHSQGLRIFPLISRAGDSQNKPFGRGSRGYKLYQEAKGDGPGVTEDEIRLFWTNNPTANIGLWTGAQSGLSAIDIDVDEFGDGNIRLAELGARNGFDVLDGSALVVLSPSGGRHLYWQYTDRIPDFFNRKSYGKEDIRYTYGFDTRNGHRGYIVLPPSAREDGSYSFENGMEASEFSLATLQPFPYEGSWFIHETRKKSPKTKARKKRKKSDKPDADFFMGKVKRLIKEPEAKAAYDLLDKYYAQFANYRNDRQPGKTITKKHVEAELAKLGDSLKKKAILRLTDKRGTVLAKPTGYVLYWYPLDFTDTIFDEDTWGDKPKAGQWWFHTFDDGVTRVYWKNYDREEGKWVRVDISPATAVSWQDILHKYL